MLNKMFKGLYLDLIIIIFIIHLNRYAVIFCTSHEPLKSISLFSRNGYHSELKCCSSNKYKPFGKSLVCGFSNGISNLQSEHADKQSSNNRASGMFILRATTSPQCLFFFFFLITPQGRQVTIHYCRKHRPYGR